MKDRFLVERFVLIVIELLFCPHSSNVEQVLSGNEGARKAMDKKASEGARVALMDSSHLIST
jgi:hypothetical protein